MADGRWRGAILALMVILPCSLAVDAMAGGSKCHPKYENQKTFMVTLKRNDAGEGLTAFVSKRFSRLPFNLCHAVAFHVFANTSSDYGACPQLERASGEDTYVKPTYTVPTQGSPAKNYNKPTSGPNWAKAAPSADMDSYLSDLTDPSRKTAVYKALLQAKQLAANQDAAGDLRLSIDEKNAAGKKVGWGSLVSSGLEPVEAKPEFQHCLDVVFMSGADGLDWDIRKQTALTLLDIPK
jgi:hypothetical protein